MGTPTVEGPIVDILPGVTLYDTSFIPLQNGKSVFLYADQFYSNENDPSHTFISVLNAPSGIASSTVQLSEAGNEDQVTVAGLADGGFVVSWRYLLHGETVIKARVFNADGSAAAPEFAISAPNTGWFYRTDLVTLADGRILATWEVGENTTAHTPQHLNAQFFSASGQTLGDNFTIATDTSNSDFNPEIAALAQGGAVLAWISNNVGFDPGIYIQLTNDRGMTVFPPTKFVPKTISHDYADYNAVRDFSVAGLADGTFLLAWTEISASGSDTDATSIQGQIFSKDGRLIGEQFQINSMAAGFQSNVSILGLDSGGFVAVWFEGTLTPGAVARGQLYLENGQKSGDEFVVVPAGSLVEVYYLDDFKLSQIDASHIIVEWGDNNVFSSDQFQIIDLQFSLIQTGTDANNILAGTRLADTIFGGLGNDSITGNLGNDSLMGDAGNDVLQGGDGNDLLFGGIGNDQLFGGAGTDQLTGGIGDDVYVIDSSPDLIIERLNEGNDKIITSAFGIDLTTFANVEKAQLEGDQKLNLTGSAVGNELVGNGVANYIDAGAGGDLVFGGAGNDVLSGGVGVDRITGGAGADFFVFRSAAEAGLGAAADQITDFAHGVDQLVVTAFTSGSAFIGAAAFSGARQVRYDNGSGVVSGDNDGNGVADWQIVLLNKPVLTATDLIL